MSIFQTLSKDPGPHTPLSRFTALSGVIYLVAGASFYAWPGQLQDVLGQPPYVGHEAGLVRVIGFTLAVVGYFYLAGARTRNPVFGIATIFDRLLVPLFLVPLGVSGAVPWPIAYVISVLDPILGLIAYVLARRSQ